MNNFHNITPVEWILFSLMALLIIGRSIAVIQYGMRNRKNNIIESEVDYSFISKSDNIIIGNFVHIGKDCIIGKKTRICDHVNMYDCVIGQSCMIGTFTEVQSNVIIANNVRLQSHSFIPSGTTIGNNTFVSHGFCGINDKFSNEKVNFESIEWGKIEIGEDVIIGSSVTMFPCKIGNGAIVGAGSLVTKDIGENELWYGRPAKFIRMKKQNIE